MKPNMWNFAIAIYSKIEKKKKEMGNLFQKIGKCESENMCIGIDWFVIVHSKFKSTSKSCVTIIAQYVSSAVYFRIKLFSWFKKTSIAL